MAYEFRANPGDTKLLLSLTYLLLASNSIGTIFRVYSSGHNWLLAFLLFMCSGFFLLEYCFTAYHRLPQHDESPRKKFLAVAIWCLFTGIVFGFTHLVAQLLTFATAAPLYAAAFAASASIFYAYFIHVDVEGCCNNNCCNNANNDNIRFSEGNLEITSDKV